MNAPERDAPVDAGTDLREDEAPVAPTGPDGFRLEGEMPRVMRLSRKTLAVLGGAAGIAIGGALLWALRPADPKAAQELYEVTDPNRSETVTGASKDYGAAPKLGPPLPGDLGRPIVSAQQDGKTIPSSAMAEAPDPAKAAAEQARQREAQEHESAKASRLFLGSASTQPSITDSVTEGTQDTANGGVAGGRRAFLAGVNKKPFESDEGMQTPSSPLVVQAGTVIPAALITGIRSDLPGQITAQVTENVYDSPTGRVLLIPQGARLVGEYDSEIVAGQQRVLLAWDRIVFAGGNSIRLDRLPGADAAGMAGLQDRVDNHWGRMLRAALISTLLGVGTELTTGGEGDLARALRFGVNDAAGEAGRRVVERELSVPPTLTVRSGFSFRVIVTRDLVLEPFGTGGRP